MNLTQKQIEYRLADDKRKIDYLLFLASGGIPGSGTVTSVGLTAPSFLAVSGSPILGFGTIALSLSGTALPTANGGTGQISYTIGDLLYASGTTTLSKLPSVASGSFLFSNGVGAAPSWESINLVVTPTGTGEAVLFDLGTDVLFHRAIGDSTFINASTASNTISLALSATGTPDNTKFLRGDNVWATPDAANGLSVNTGKIVLGQNVGEVGSPATLLSTREIPLNGFHISLTSSTGGLVAITKTRTLSGSVQSDIGLSVQSLNQVVDGATVTGTQGQFLFAAHGIQGTANFGVNPREAGSVYLARFFHRSTTPTAASIVNSGVTPLNATPTVYIKNGVSGSGTVTMNGWYSNINSEFQINPTSGASVIANFADIIIGISTSSVNASVTTRHGLYINPIKQSFVTGTGYSIFQEGTTDINHLAGVLRLTNLPIYADEAAAIIGGLVTNTVYRTSTGELRIKL